ncbi:MAG: PEP-CTERM sorting domain-containing protein [Cognaticolwellia sp.]
MKLLKSLVLATSLLFSQMSSASLMLWLDPDIQPGVTGDDITLTLMAGGLDDEAPLSLGAFDLDILFDSSVLSFTGYTLFDELGFIDFFEAGDFSLGEYAPGVVGISEVSFLLPSELDAMQSSSFALAELMFHIDLLEASDFTIVSMTPGLFGFSDGDGVAFDEVELGSALIGTPPDVNVPEPSTLALLSLAGLLVVFRRKLAIK